VTLARRRHVQWRGNADPVGVGDRRLTARPTGILCHRPADTRDRGSVEPGRGALRTCWPAGLAAGTGVRGPTPFIGQPGDGRRGVNREQCRAARHSVAWGTTADNVLVARCAACRRPPDARLDSVGKPREACPQGRPGRGELPPASCRPSSDPATGPGDSAAVRAVQTRADSSGLRVAPAAAGELVRRRRVAVRQPRAVFATDVAGDALADPRLAHGQSACACSASPTRSRRAEWRAGSCCATIRSRLSRSNIDPRRATSRRGPRCPPVEGRTAAGRAWLAGSRWAVRNHAFRPSWPPRRWLEELRDFRLARPPPRSSPIPGRSGCCGGLGRTDAAGLATRTGHGPPEAWGRLGGRRCFRPARLSDYLRGARRTAGR